MQQTKDHSPRVNTRVPLSGRPQCCPTRSELQQYVNQFAAIGDALARLHKPYFFQPLWPKMWTDTLTPPFYQSP